MAEATVGGGVVANQAVAANAAVAVETPARHGGQGGGEGVFDHAQGSQVALLCFGIGNERFASITSTTSITRATSTTRTTSTSKEPIEGGLHVAVEGQGVVLAPEVVVVAAGAEGIDEISARDGWGDITAIKEKNIYYDETSMMTRPGPRLKDAVIALYDFVYGDEAAEVPAA